MPQNDYKYSDKIFISTNENVAQGNYVQIFTALPSPPDFCSTENLLIHKNILKLYQLYTVAFLVSSNLFVISTSMDNKDFLPF